MVASTVQDSQVFQRVISEKSPILTKANGMYITVEDPVSGEQKEIIDAMTGAAVGSLGHQDAEIVQAMCDAAKTSNYSFGIYLGNRASEELSSLL